MFGFMKKSKPILQSVQSMKKLGDLKIAETDYESFGIEK